MDPVMAWMVARVGRLERMDAETVGLPMFPSSSSAMPATILSVFPVPPSQSPPSLWATLSVPSACPPMAKTFACDRPTAPDGVRHVTSRERKGEQLDPAILCPDLKRNVDHPPQHTAVEDTENNIFCHTSLDVGLGVEHRSDDIVDDLAKGEAGRG